MSASLVDIGNSSMENESQGIRTGIAQQPNGQFSERVPTWGNRFDVPNPDPVSNFAGNPSSSNSNLNRNLHKENSLAPHSSGNSASSSGSFGGGVSFFPFNSSSSSSISFSEENGPSVLGLHQDSSLKERNSSSGARRVGFNGNNNNNTSNVNANFNPFVLTSSSTPRKSTPLCEPFQPPASVGKSKVGSSSRPRMVKVRRNSSAAKGMAPAASSGKEKNGFGEKNDFGEKNGFGDEPSGYNPFRSGAGIHFEQQSSNTTSSRTFSTAFGENVVSQGFNREHSGDGKGFPRNNSTNVNGDLNVRLSSRKPFVESSGVKRNAGVGTSSFSFSAKSELGGFTFMTGGDKTVAAAKEKTDNEAEAEVGSWFSGMSGNVKVGDKVNEINSGRSFRFGNDGLQAGKPSEINSVVGRAPLQGQQASVLSATRKPKSRIGARRRVQDLRSGAVSRSSHGLESNGQNIFENSIASQSSGLKDGGQGGADASFVSQSSVSGLKKNVGSTFENPYANLAAVLGSVAFKSSGAATTSNEVDPQKPVSYPNFAGFSTDSSFGFSTGRPSSSIFTFNAGGKVESEKKEVSKPSPLVEPISFSAGSASAFFPPQSPVGSSQETMNEAIPDVLSSREEVGFVPVPSGVETLHSGASSPKKDSSWPFMESLSSSLNEVFEFTADKGASQTYSSKKKKKREKSNLPASIRGKLGKHSILKSKRYVPSSVQTNDAEGGSPMDFSPYAETPIASKGDNMPDLGQPPMAWATPVECSFQAKHNLHESLVMEAKVDELRAAAANLHIGSDNETGPRTFHQEESSEGVEHQSWKTSNRMHEADVGDKGKSSSSQEQMAIPSFESEWLNSRMEKVRIDDVESTNSALKDEGSHQSQQFTFGTSSPPNVVLSSRSRRHSRRSYRAKVGESTSASSSVLKFDMPHFATKSFDFEKHGMQEHISIALRNAAENLHIGSDKKTGPKTFHQEESSEGGEHQSWKASNRMHEADICDKGKTLSSDEQTVIPSSESEWLSSKMEKVRIDDVESTNSTLKDEGSYQSQQFTFGISSPLNSMFYSRSRRHSRRSYRPKVGESTSASSSELKFDMPHVAAKSFDFEKHGMQGHISIPRGDKSQETTKKGEEETKGMADQARLFNGPTSSGIFSSIPKYKEENGAVVSPRAVKSAAAEQACEKWRLRGNQAYANGDFPKAEDCYSRGASSVSPNETSESCIRASMLCYSNRAATRMVVGRVREALADCMRAMAIDPIFLRVQIRAASCHLSLGESEAAISLYKRCLDSANDLATLDLKIAGEASDGLRKAKQGLDYTKRAMELLDLRNPGDATNAVRILNEALSISPHSEHLLELKALALLILRKYEEVIQVCEQSMDSAERNYCLPNNDSELGGEDSLGNMAKFPIKLWRWQMSAKAYFHLGRLEDALDLLLKYEELNSAVERSSKESQESLASFTVTIRDLLRHKTAGNKAFQSGKHAEAVEHYTAALACNGESWPFTAVCFCNRAAASQALGHIADAIADCSRAIALDPNYPKAISRRATLHEMVRDYGHAVNDLERLIMLMDKQQKGKGAQLGGLSNSRQDIRQARERLAKAEEEMKRGHSLDHYLILGVEASSTTAEIKKAYRKAALRHHPDKAGQFLVRSDSGDDSHWKEVGEEVRRDAERLFKLIGEAYAILSDSHKRVRYDTEEELRKPRTRGSSSGPENGSESYRYQYEKGNRRQRDRWDYWNGYGNQYQRWQSGPDAAQPDTYACWGSNNKGSSDGSRWNDWDYT